MGGSLSSPARPVQVLMLGLDQAGKSSVLARLAGEEVRSLTPTRGFSIHMLNIAGSSQPTFKVWDLGGGHDVRHYWPAYYSRAQAIVFVVDATDRLRLHETSVVLQQLLDEESLLGLPLLLFANKQDMPHALQAGEVRQARRSIHAAPSLETPCANSSLPCAQLEEVLHLGSIKDRAWLCFACSALRGSGLNEGFVWLRSAA